MLGVGAGGVRMGVPVWGKGRRYRAECGVGMKVGMEGENLLCSAVDLILDLGQIICLSPGGNPCK